MGAIVDSQRNYCTRRGGELPSVSCRESRACCKSGRRGTPVLPRWPAIPAHLDSALPALIRG